MGGVRDVIARMPQLRKCEIDFVTDRQQRSHLGRGAIDIDGFIEMFFDSYGDMQQAMDEAGDALLAALEPLVEEPVSTLVAVKKVDTPVPAYLDGKAIKRVSFCDRAEGVDAATFHDEWWYTHSLLVKLMSGYCGYNQNLVIDRMVQGAPCRSKAWWSSGSRIWTRSTSATARSVSSCARACMQRSSSAPSRRISSKPCLWSCRTRRSSDCIANSA